MHFALNLVILVKNVWNFTNITQFENVKNLGLYFCKKAHIYLCIKYTYTRTPIHAHLCTSTFNMRDCKFQSTHFHEYNRVWDERAQIVKRARLRKYRFTTFYRFNNPLLRNKLHTSTIINVGAIKILYQESYSNEVKRYGLIGTTCLWPLCQRSSLPTTLALQPVAAEEAFVIKYFTTSRSTTLISTATNAVCQLLYAMLSRFL